MLERLSIISTFPRRRSHFIFLLTVLWALFLVAVFVQAQPSVSIGTGPVVTPLYPEFAVASLPASPPTGTVVIVTDSATSGDCTTGGGSATAHCRWDGSAWAPIGAAASGEVTSPFQINNGVQNANFTVDGSGNLTVEQTGTDTFFEAGRVTVQSSSTNAFSVTNTPGSVIAFHADASNARIGVGGANPITTLDVQTGDVTIRNGTTPTRLDLYSTRTDASNFERLSLQAQSADSYLIESEAAGTGTIRDIGFIAAKIGVGTASPSVPFHVLRSDDTAQVFVEDTGTTAQDLLVLKNGGPSRIALQNTASSGEDTWRFNHASNGNFRITAAVGSTEMEIEQGGNVILDIGMALRETTTPPAGVTDQAILFAQDNGAGKTQLMVQFPTGAAQQISIEP